MLGETRPPPHVSTQTGGSQRAPFQLQNNTLYLRAFCMNFEIPSDCGQPRVMATPAPVGTQGKHKRGQAISSQPTPRNIREAVANREKPSGCPLEVIEMMVEEPLRREQRQRSRKRKKEGKGGRKVRTLGYHLTASHLLTGNNKKRTWSIRDFGTRRTGKRGFRAREEQPASKFTKSDEPGITN